MWHGTPAQASWWPNYNAPYAAQGQNAGAGDNSQAWAMRAAMWAQQRQFQEQMQAQQHYQVHQQTFANNFSPPVSQPPLPPQPISTQATSHVERQPLSSAPAHERSIDMKPDIPPGVETRQSRVQTPERSHEIHRDAFVEQPHSSHERNIDNRTQEPLRHHEHVDRRRHEHEEQHHHPQHASERQGPYPDARSSPPRHHHHHHHSQHHHSEQGSSHHHEEVRHTSGGSGHVHRQEINIHEAEARESPFGHFGPPRQEHSHFQQPPMSGHPHPPVEHPTPFGFSGQMGQPAPMMPVHHGIQAPFPYPVNEFGHPHGNNQPHVMLPPNHEEQFMAGDAELMKKKMLPQWLREGLEKMEKDKSKKDPQANTSPLPSASKISGYQHRVEESPPPSPDKVPQNVDEETTEDNAADSIKTPKSGSGADSSGSDEEEDEEEREALLMQRVKRLITDVLLSVTASEIAMVAQEVCNQARAKVSSSKQLRHSGGLDALRMGFGSASSSEDGGISDDETRNESPDPVDKGSSDQASKGHEILIEASPHMDSSHRIGNVDEEELSSDGSDEKSVVEKKLGHHKSESERGRKKASKSKKRNKRKHHSPSPSHSAKKLKRKSSEHKSESSRRSRDSSEEHKRKRKHHSSRKKDTSSSSNSASSDDDDVTSSSDSESRDSDSSSSEEQRKRRHSKSKKRRKHKSSHDKKHHSDRRGKKHRKHKSKSSRSDSPSRKRH